MGRDKERCVTVSKSVPWFNSIYILQVYLVEFKVLIIKVNGYH